MICFYGNTGSGKSTSVNFLMGIPLRKSKNVMGEETISI
jgi:energy-coupling factor transporter ATP-binding protein EcfA2